MRTVAHMAKELTPIDISSAPELLRLAEQVRQEGKPAKRSVGADIVLEVRPARPLRADAPTTPRRKSGSTTDYDELQKLETMFAPDGGPADVSVNKHGYLADAYADLHRKP